MNIQFQLAWRNLWRNPRRSIITLIAIIVSSVFLIFMASFQNGSYREMIKTAVGTTGELQIQAKDYFKTPDIRKTIFDPDTLKQAALQLPGVQSVTTRAEAFALVSSDTQSAGVMIQGVEPDAEAAMSPLDDALKEGKWIQPATNEVVVGRALANHLQLKIGSDLVVIGQGYDGSAAASVFQVVGIFESGFMEADRNLIIVPIQTLQEVFCFENRVHRLVINGTDFSKPDRIRDEAQTWLDTHGEPYVAYTWAELIPGLNQTIKLDRMSAVIIYLVLLIIVAFSISNTFLMAIMERIYEFGVLLAIGTSRRRLLQMLFLETGMIALLGVVIGIGVGVAITAWFQHQGIDLGEASEMTKQYGIPSRLHPMLSPVTIFMGPTFVFIFTLISATYPIFRVRKLNPVSAMRSA